MRRDLFVYLSGPMTAKDGHSIEENVAAGVRAFIACMKAGVPAFCPHLSGGFPSCWSDVDWQAWLDYDFAVIDRCTHVVMLPRWETSTGAVAEMNYATARGVPVFLSFEGFMAWLQRQTEVA